MKLRLRDLRQARNLSLRDMADQLNISFSQLARIERGDSLASSEQIIEFAKFFGVSTDFLLGVPKEIISYNNGLFKDVKILGSVNAGTPEEMQDYYLGLLQAKVDVADDYFYLEVNGDSMSPTFEDGDYVLVKFQRTAENNEVVVAGLNGSEATVKRYKKIGEEQFLFADNTKYDPIKLSEELNPYIVGVVEGYFRPKIK